MATNENYKAICNNIVREFSTLCYCFIKVDNENVEPKSSQNIISTFKAFWSFIFRDNAMAIKRFNVIDGDAPSGVHFNLPVYSVPTCLLFTCKSLIVMNRTKLM